MDNLTAITTFIQNEITNQDSALWKYGIEQNNLAIDAGWTAMYIWGSFALVLIALSIIFAWVRNLNLKKDRYYEFADALTGCSLVAALSALIITISLVGTGMNLRYRLINPNENILEEISSQVQNFDTSDCDD